MKIYTARTDAEVAKIVYERNQGVHVHALVEDIGYTVTYPRRRRHDAFTLRFSGKDVDKTIERGFAVHHYWGAGSAITEFIEGAARTIAGHGQAWYELALDVPERRFRVIAVIPDTLRVLPFNAVQVLRSDRPGKRFDLHRIPRRVLRNISPPVISPLRWRSMVATVERLENAQLIGMDSSLTSKNTAYVPGEHMRAVNEGILKATQPIQYMPRNFGYDEGVSPALAGYRWALFNGFCARLRERIVSEVNAILSIAGSCLGFTAAVSLDDSTPVEQWEIDATRIRESDDPNSVVQEIRDREQ